MPPDPVLPPSLAAEVADLKRRLANLERSPSIPFSSSRGGVFVFRDNAAAPKPRFELGNASLAGTGLPSGNQYGVFARGDEAGIALMLREGSRGLISPSLPVSFVDRDSSNAIIVTSSTFVETHESYILFPSHEVLTARVIVSTDASTTAEVRLINLDTDSVTDSLTVSASTTKIVVFDWLVETSVGLYDQHAHSSNLLAVATQVRRASGAGNVRVRPALATLTSKFLVPAAAANGNPH